MTENRYYKKDWEESYYIFDSNTISEDEFEERVEYEGYDVFADSLTSSEIIELLNENDKLKQHLSQLAKVNHEGVQKVQSLAKENEQLKKEINKYIVVNNGLNTEYEWLKEENEQLKSENKRLKRLTTQYHVIDIEKVLPAIAECKGITVEEYLEEIEEEYTKEGDLE